MRLTAYAGASTLLAVAVILRAFNERPNFYSASVYLAQSNACRMILLNLLFLFTGGLVFSLQRLLYGPLRPIEIEQLWDKAWYAITETALAMTTFRDEIGGWFFLMFVSLLSGKVWQWISEGRVEILEQQPPANPRLFHIRLIGSLLLSELFDILMLRYCVQTLLDQPKPGMMVMFAFEFAVLAISSSSTAARYSLSLHEAYIIKRQTMFKLEERREELLAAREEASRENGTESGRDQEENLASSDITVDEDDIDVPGWQEKGRWILFLDLSTDFLKLLVYIGFFTILLVFHGIPIHIIRDVFVTARSFLKRISDFVKYRNATRDMNARYADATSAELRENGTCIICREEMRPWQQPEPLPHPGIGARQRRREGLLDERQRPKKLPCGHILHFGCLRSWLERQQVCPTCRSSVLAVESTARTNTILQAQNNQDPANAPRIPRQANQNPGRQGHPVVQEPFQGEQGTAQRRMQRRNEARTRTFTLGPWRVTLATGNEQQVHDTLQRLREQNGVNTSSEGRNAAMMERASASQNQPTQEQGDASVRDQINAIERRLFREIQSLNVALNQLATVNLLQGELARLRNLPSYPEPQHLIHPYQQNVYQQHLSPFTAANNLTSSSSPAQHRSGSGVSSSLRNNYHFHPSHTSSIPQYVYSSVDSQTTLGSEYGDLPSGMVLPEGWTLLPLRSMAWQRRGELSNSSEATTSTHQPATGHTPAPISRTDQDSRAGSTAITLTNSLTADEDEQPPTGMTIMNSGVHGNRNQVDTDNHHPSFGESTSQSANSMKPLETSAKTDTLEPRSPTVHGSDLSMNTNTVNEAISITETSSKCNNLDSENPEDSYRRQTIKKGKERAKNVTVEDASDE